MVTEKRVLRAHSQMSQAGQGLGYTTIGGTSGEVYEFPAICTMEKLDSSIQTHHPSCSETGLIWC